LAQILRSGKAGSLGYAALKTLQVIWPDSFLRILSTI
jgi:hypothetical protein